MTNNDNARDDAVPLPVGILDNLVEKYGPDLVRTAMKAAGGALVAHGFTQTGNLLDSQQIVGYALVVAGLGWSWWRSHRSDVRRVLAAYWEAKVRGWERDAARPPAVSAPRPGPTAALLVAVLLLPLLLAVPAHAQAHHTPLTGNPVADIENAVGGAATNCKVGSNPLDPLCMWSKLQTDLVSVSNFFSQWTSDELDAAVVLSVQIPTIQDWTGNTCWRTFQNVGAVVRAHPLPITLRTATDIEASRLFAAALSQACQQPMCSQVWADLTNQATALGSVPLPPLSSVCSKIMPPALGTAPATSPTVTTSPAAPVPAVVPAPAH